MPIFVCRVIDKRGKESVIEHRFPNEEVARHKLLNGLLDIDSGLTRTFRDVLSIREVEDDYFEKKLAGHVGTTEDFQDVSNGDGNIILTTSFSVSGREIERDLSIITARSVQGINAVSDAVIDLSNVFGGTSSTFESYMEQAENRLLLKLRSEAEKLGGDAVICVTISHNHIPPRMLMSSACGTAVRLKAS